MNAPLLATKLNQPHLRAKIISRLHLVERLDSGLIKNGDFGRRLTLVSAPAGYGKTTLVVEWINHSGLPVGWVSLDEADNDPRRFITYLIAAMSQVSENVGKAATAMLQSPQPPPEDVLLTALINEISADSQSFILVLDDYHVIRTPSIHQQLAFLLEHQPSNLHLVITTREDPLLPIARLRARGHVTEIHQDDLRFTTDETANFLGGVMGLDLPPDEVTALEQRTEGWIAGLQLAALSMQGRDDLSGFIQAFTGSNRFILDYLIEEVFERQSPDVKDFLLKTSILERLSGSLCNAVTEKTDGQELLEILEQTNLFIVPLDQSRDWFRYHRLFAELLRHRLRISNLSVKALHQRASVWFETNGFMSEAIQHALDAQDWERAGSIIQNINSDFLKRGEILTVIGWFQSLPEEMLLSNPKLCFEYCWPLLLAAQFDKAAPLLECVEQVAKDKPPFLGEVYAAQAYLARVQGDHKRMVERSQSALKLLPKSSVDSRGIVAVNLGLAYWHMGQMQAAEEALKEALEAGKTTGNHYVALTALIFLGRVLAVRGHLHQAVGFFESAINQGNEIPINALAYMDLAILHYEWNALDESDKHLQKAIALCQRSKNYEFLVGAWLIQSRLSIAQSDIAGAEEALEQAWLLVHNEKIPAPTVERVDVAQAHLQLAKKALLGEWGQKLNKRVDCHPFYRFLGVTRAKILPDPDAITYLDGLSKAAQANEWVYGLIAVRVLQAVLTESKKEAFSFLKEALQQAEGGGFIRSFVEVGEKLVPLLRQAVQQGINTDYAGHLLSVMMKKTDLAGVDQSSLIEPLSERELEVLRLLAAGLTNRQIADQLVVSISTVKSHVHHISGKLDASNRTQAVARARELNLL